VLARARAARKIRESSWRAARQRVRRELFGVWSFRAGSSAARPRCRKLGSHACARPRATIPVLVSRRGTGPGKDRAFVAGGCMGRSCRRGRPICHWCAARRGSGGWSSRTVRPQERGVHRRLIADRPEGGAGQPTRARSSSTRSANSVAIQPTKSPMLQDTQPTRGSVTPRAECPTERVIAATKPRPRGESARRAASWPRNVRSGRFSRIRSRRCARRTSDMHALLAGRGSTESPDTAAGFP